MKIVDNKVGKQHVCIETFTKNGFTYFEKDKVYTIKIKKDYDDGEALYQIFDINGDNVISIVENLVSRYFLTMAEFRDNQIETIIND